MPLKDIEERKAYQKRYWKRKSNEQINLELMELKCRGFSEDDINAMMEVE